VSPLDAFPALRVAAYRRLLAALIVSQVAMYMFETTLYWTVLELTGSAVLVSLLLASIVVPVLVLTVPVGLVVDHYGPSRLLGPASIAAAIVGGLATIVTAISGLSFELALLLAMAEGAFFGCWAIPAQVLASRVVDREQMPSAIGLSALPSGVGAVLGGLSGGVILQVAGPATAFALAAGGLTLSAIIMAGLPKLPGLGSTGGRAFAVGELYEAFGWARKTPVALAVIALGSAAGFLVMSRFGLVPVLVHDVLHAGPAALGLIVMAGGIGSILGTTAVDATGRRLRRGPVLLSALAVAGLALATLGSAPHLVIALGAAGLITGSLIVYHVTSMTLLQVLAPARMRGRILAIYDLVRLGLVPPGSLVAGLLVPVIGVTGVFLSFGGLVVVAVIAATVVCRPLVVLQLEVVLADAHTPQDLPVGERGAAGTESSG
jgi:MFS family permease